MTKTTPSFLERMERAKKAHDLHASGLTWREVGVELGVGKQRASHLAHLYNYWMKRGNRPESPMHELSGHPLGALSYFFGYKDFTPEQVSKLSKSYLLSLYGLGKTSLKEIEEWLNRHGFKLVDDHPRRHKNWIDAYEEYHVQDTYDRH